MAGVEEILSMRKDEGRSLREWKMRDLDSGKAIGVEQEY